MKMVAVVTRIGLLAVLVLALGLGSSQAAAPGAWVASVDQPENCLRIRSGPGTGYGVVGCAERGTPVRLTGNRTATDWVEIERPVQGWVWGPQISGGSAAHRSSVPAVRNHVYGPPYPRNYRYNLPYADRSGFYYGGPGVGVRVGPGGGVDVRAGGVGVRVGPGGGVGVSVR